MKKHLILVVLIALVPGFAHVACAGSAYTPEHATGGATSRGGGWLPAVCPTGTSAAVSVAMCRQGRSKRLGRPTGGP